MPLPITFFYPACNREVTFFFINLKIEQIQKEVKNWLKFMILSQSTRMGPTHHQKKIFDLGKKKAANTTIWLRKIKQFFLKCILMYFVCNWHFKYLSFTCNCIKYHKHYYISLEWFSHQNQSLLYFWRHVEANEFGGKYHSKGGIFVFIIDKQTQ